ncbi:siderophore-interacting protein [Xylanimonas protaetiae]|uniref:Siderophore-interacting protein n=1 Tax=Xylanimonas protaetiae TaxID=2509457 RepID=A0A4V0YGP4_9MICO|nr:siderophore-interacting protein [Xylanimonas protaetiae]
MDRDARAVVRRPVGTLGRRVLHVVRVEDVTPRYRRVVLGGADLDAGFPWADLAPTDHVKVVFPDPATGELLLPQPGPGGLRNPDGTRPAVRDYTVRAWDAEARELTLDLVLHGHGVASRWASSARPGDGLGVLGPRGNVLFPHGYPCYLAVGDATALPAISRLLEELPDGARATAILEVEDAAEEQRIASREGVEIVWVHRGAHPEADRLERALRAWTPPQDDDWFAFAAGEATAMRPVRQYLRHELGLPRAQVHVDGYWKRGEAGLDHHAVDLGDD